MARSRLGDLAGIYLRKKCSFALTLFNHSCCCTVPSVGHSYFKGCPLQDGCHLCKYFCPEESLTDVLSRDSVSFFKIFSECANYFGASGQGRGESCSFSLSFFPFY
jgi:hypothetical protein